MGGGKQKVRVGRFILATLELRKRPGKSEVDNASWNCFRGREQNARPLKQSRHALSTSITRPLAQFRSG